MDNFLDDVRRFVGKVPFTKDAVSMYFCMIDANTPLIAKATIGAALAYFIAPVDGILDIVPFLGFTDDATVIAAAFAAVSSNINEEHRRQAVEFFQ
jgi:uncharacterized membrane protein YkvA (DUF1232 family)